MSRRSKSKTDPVVQCRVSELRDIYRSFQPDFKDSWVGFAALICGIVKAPTRSDDRRVTAAYDLGWRMRVAADQKADAAKLRSEISVKRKWFIKSMITAGSDYACTKCGSTDGITIDHIRPISCGGGNDLDNLQFLCRRCNSKKGAR